MADSTVTMQLEGVEDVQNALDAYVKRIETGVKALIKRHTDIIVRDAKEKVPVDTGALRASIKAELEATAEAVVGTASAGEGLDPNYAPFVEFGTGDRVRVPKGLEAYARTFYVSGLGHAPAQPYLVPSWFARKNDFVHDLKMLLDS